MLADGIHPPAPRQNAGQVSGAEAGFGKIGPVIGLERQNSGGRAPPEIDAVGTRDAVGFAPEVMLQLGGEGGPLRGRLR